MHVIVGVYTQDGKSCLQIAFERDREEIVGHLCGLRLKKVVIQTIKVGERHHQMC